MDEKIIETVEAEVVDTEQEVESSSLVEISVKIFLGVVAFVGTAGIGYFVYKQIQKKKNPELYYRKIAERLEKKSEKAKAKFEKAWDQWKEAETANESVQEDIYEEVED